MMMTNMKSNFIKKCDLKDKMKHLSSYTGMIAAWDPDSFTASHSMVSHLRFNKTADWVDWTACDGSVPFDLFDNRLSHEI